MFADHPRIDVTGFEAVIGTKYSADTIAWLKRESPETHFVWLMGADNLKDFHRWKNWREIFMMLPIAVADELDWFLQAFRDYLRTCDGEDVFAGSSQSWR